ncbi:DNA protecting protein DprA [Gottschalkia purinilytica]|uniref:DNA protecting protein DprA n=1 Tax=Gottschalkia purinilytica TaxID=1503 RepID=A0A0L0WBI8_GOTPU|nr:DNA-processing protein DprA [Gottschalkia purinilytica]KNF08802.1 DNA protecting protein DprA [Gottschalkia purinilytica]
MDNRDTLIWLNNIRGVSNKIIEKLEKYYVDIKNIWYSSNDDILRIQGINEKTKLEIIKLKDYSYYERIMENVDKLGIKVVTIYDNNFPNRLRHIYNCPKVLYIKGDLLIEDHISIAIVGSRKVTAYGKWAAEKFATELAKIGVTTISGMAKGVDTDVHRSTIKSNGRTIAVLGSGLDVIYPKSNKNLYEEIIYNGCVMSEFPLGTQPFAYNFPQRNRIVSGLSLGVVVIEAGEKSGSLITAQHALEQGKDVFALPGNINSIYSIGTNKLIKDGAKLLLSLDDIIEEIIELKDISKKINVDNRNIIDYEELSEKEVQIFKCIQEGTIHLDMISYKTGINISSVTSILTILEIKGIIKQLPGKLFSVK